MNDFPGTVAPDTDALLPPNDSQPRNNFEPHNSEQRTSEHEGFQSHHSQHEELQERNSEHEQRDRSPRLQSPLSASSSASSTHSTSDDGPVQPQPSKAKGRKAMQNLAVKQPLKKDLASMAARSGVNKKLPGKRPARKSLPKGKGKKTPAAAKGKGKNKAAAKPKRKFKAGSK
ncbi:MAG: hypothetical protein Q9180_007042 [Flavoplaca navasiana]